MKQLICCLAALVLVISSIGCSNEATEEEVKQAEEQMKQQEAEMKELLPVKLK